MNSFRQQNMQKDKKIVGSTNITHIKHKEEEQVSWGIALCSFEEEGQCYIDSGCSHHMFWSKDKFISLKKKKSGKIILGNGSSAKFIGIGNANIDVKNRETTNVQLVWGLKENILSVGQIANNGNVFTLTSSGCKIIEKGTGEFIEKGYWNSDKLYMLTKNTRRTKRSNSSSSYSE